MASFVYRPQAAIDAAGELVTGASGAVYAITDTAFATPLTVTSLAGLSMTSIEVSGIGQTQTFVLDRPEVWWKSGQYVCHLFSVTSMVENTAASALAAQTAASAAENAAAIAALGSVPNGGTTGQVLTKTGNANGETGWVNPTGGSGGGSGGGVSIHGALSGLSADDHPQYLNNTRGDARYYLKAEIDSKVSVAAGANSAADRTRSNHTGSQAISTVTGLQEALDSITALLAARVQSVRVVTGSEARPSGSGLVIWVGGLTRPAAMAVSDVWLQEG